MELAAKRRPQLRLRVSIQRLRKHRRMRFSVPTGIRIARFGCDARQRDEATTTAADKLNPSHHISQIPPTSAKDHDRHAVVAAKERLALRLPPQTSPDGRRPV